MKAICALLTGLVIILTFKVGYSQTNIYHPFPSSNADWIYYQFSPCLNPNDWPPCYLTDLHPYYYEQKGGDTVVNFVTYHKIFRLDSGAVNNLGTYMAGGIREDNNKKIYFLDFSNASPEFMLYDFSSTNVGDTLVHSYFPPCNQDNTVGIINSIDSVQTLDGLWRKRYWVTANTWQGFPTDYVIEGIGLQTDLMAGPCTYEFLRTGFSCFHENNFLLYQQTSCNYYYSHLGTFEITNNLNTSIFPNPSDGEFIIKSEGFGSKNLEIYNILGENVYSTNINSQTSIINLMVPSGTYFLQLKTGQGTANKKIIIQKK